MAELTVHEFPAFFEAVHGTPPFVWQTELARRVVDGEGWPEAIDVPTGLGKTAAIDVAVFALAFQANQQVARRTAPTRTFAVVDRRVVVDQTFERAVRLASALRMATEGVVAEVGDALRGLTGGGAEASPLEVVRMRGGITWSWRWLPSPDQPAVVVGTVDQFGSRLLFRGYGVGARLRPIDAALCGADALVVLDEAHLSRPLVDTAVAVHAYEASAERPVLTVRRSHPVLVSATLPRGQRSVFRPDLDAETSVPARQRLDAVKRTALVELSSRAKDPVPDLGFALAAVAADKLGGAEGVERLAVVCNTIALARQTHALLHAQLGDAAETAMLIGRCREYDRARLADEYGRRLQAALQRPPLDRPLVVVSTQTIEVGADFDVDALVTEAAPLDALVQRLGRLNRLGRRSAAEAVVVHCAARHAQDPVYGPATDRTWAWLTGQSGPPAETSPKQAAAAAREGPSLDLGASGAARALTPDQASELAGEPPPSPVILGPVLDLWARTEPAPEPDQPVAPFLHGLERAVPEVLVCWRAGLPVLSQAGALEAWESELQATPVLAEETVSVPIWDAVRFLAGLPPRHLADLEGTGDSEFEELDELDEHEPLHAVVLDAGGLHVARARRLTPGATVVVRAEEGGHDLWGWTGERGTPVLDIADLCRRPTRLRLRLRSGLLANVLGGDRWDELFRGLPSGDEAQGPRDLVRVETLLARVVDHMSEVEARGAAVVLATIDDLRRGIDSPPGRRGAFIAREIFPDCYLVQAIHARWGIGLRQPDAEGDDEDLGSSTALAPVGLARHLRDVAERAGAVAQRLGLDADLVAAVELAARAHDLGKADPRFQLMLHGGDRLRAEACAEPLAKSGIDPGDRTQFRRARELSRWPAGMRHEAISAAMVRRLLDEHPDLAGSADAQLVHHLVATHHGWSRPLSRPVPDTDPQPVEAALPGTELRIAVRSDESLVDWSGPAQFQLLCRRYGRWGLALLETIVRLSDIGCSEEYGR